MTELTREMFNADLAGPEAPRPRTQWNMKYNDFKCRIPALDRMLGYKVKVPRERKGRNGAERPHRALFRRVYEDQHFPRQHFVLPVKCSPLGEGAPRTYPRTTDSTVNVNPGGATTTPIQPFELFEYEVNAAGWSWVDMTNPWKPKYKNPPKGWLFGENRRLVRKQEKSAPIEEKAPVKKQEEVPVKKDEAPVKEENKRPVKEGNKASLASTASGSLLARGSSRGTLFGEAQNCTTTLPLPKNARSEMDTTRSSRKRRADSIEDSSADGVQDATSKRARRALPSEQFRSFASLQPPSSITKATGSMRSVLQPLGSVLNVLMPGAKARVEAKPESKPHCGLGPKMKPQEDDSPSPISKKARRHDVPEPCPKHKAEDMDGPGNPEDSRKIKQPMKNHRVDKAERAKAADSNSKQPAKQSAEHYRGSDQKSQNSNKRPFKSQIYNDDPALTTGVTDLSDDTPCGPRTLKDVLEEAGQPAPRGSSFLFASFPLSLMKFVNWPDLEKAVEDSSSSSSTKQSSPQHTASPKRKVDDIDDGSVEQSEQPAKRLRVRKTEESKKTDSNEQTHSQKLKPTKLLAVVKPGARMKAAEARSKTAVKNTKKPTERLADVVKPGARMRAAEDRSKTAVKNTEKSTSPTSSTPATPPPTSSSMASKGSKSSVHALYSSVARKAAASFPSATRKMMRTVTASLSLESLFGPGPRGSEKRISTGTAQDTSSS